MDGCARRFLFSSHPQNTQCTHQDVGREVDGPEVGVQPGQVHAQELLELERAEFQVWDVRVPEEAHGKARGG